MRKLAALVLLAFGVTRLVRRRAAERLRLDVYYEDGSMLSLPPAVPDASAALARATDALRAAGAR